MKQHLHRFRARSAFSLVELTVALVILAALAHIALRETSRLRERRLAEAADRQLEEIRDSVCSRLPGGRAGGFLSDMGRLPEAGDSTPATLRELWEMPEGALPFAVREAVATNLAVAAERKAALAEAGVWVPTGWNGPYIRLPVGRGELLDPWGNPFANPDSAGYSRLAVATNGAITAVTHFGPSAKADDPHRRTLSITPSGGAEGTLTVNISTVETAGTATLKWFGPASGMITGAVASVTVPGTVRFEGITPGVRVLWDSATKAPRFVDIAPGDNVLQLNLP